MFKRENLRKNFLRVKQNIDQNLGRAEKSEVLSEDQQENEKRAEQIKHAFQNIAKKASCILQGPGTDFEKRLKKVPESGLSAALLESGQALGQETLLGNVCKLCGDCQYNLAMEQVTFEMVVESEFVNPIQTICDVDIPSIMKFRKALNKSTLDMDSAKNRLTQMVRQSHVPGANMSNTAAKVDVIKEEYEEAAQKVETIKDNLSIELCNFAARESEHSHRMLALLKAQADFHRKALQAIEDCIPHVSITIENSPCKPVFGVPLEEHLRLMCRDIALVLEACILTLLDCGMEEEGLFRIAGAAIKLKKLKACFDANLIDMEEFANDPHTVAGALKQYLRELPEPLLTFALHDDFLKSVSLPQDQRLQTLWTLLSKLPKANYNNFRYLIKFLAKLAEKCDVNKMKPSNIAIVIGPNLLWTERNNAPNMLTTGTVSAIIEAIVTHADWFFPGAFDFHLTGHGSSPKPCREPGFANSTKPQCLKVKVSKEKPSEVTRDISAKDALKKDNDKREHWDSHGASDKEKVLPLEQGFVVPAFELHVQKPKKDSEHGCGSSDESCPFSEQIDTSSEKENIDQEGEDLPSSSCLMYAARHNGSHVATSSTNTGDYDNILYTFSTQNPMSRSSTMSRGYGASKENRRGSVDNLLPFSKQLPTPVPPSRPSRLTKRQSPKSSEQLSFSGTSRSESQSPHPDTSRSAGTLSQLSKGLQQPSSRYITGSTPNIASLPYNRMEEETYSGLQGSLWNRPNQKTNFHTLKRGSDPCIIPPPPPQFNSYSSQRPLKVWRSQLGTPPKPGDIPRLQPTPQDEMSRSQPGQGSMATSVSHQVHSPVDKSFHQDTYSTAFALTSLGAGAKSTDYLTQVRAMWDDRHQQQVTKSPTNFKSPNQGKLAESLSPELNQRQRLTSPSGSGVSASNFDSSAKCTGEKEIKSTVKEQDPRHCPAAASVCNTTHLPSYHFENAVTFPLYTSSGDSTALGISSPPSSLASQQAEFDFHNVGCHDEEFLEGSQVQSGTQQNSNESLHVQVSASQPVTQQPSPSLSSVSSTNSSSSNLPVPQDSPEPVSPIHRRMTRKPAPPPPPDKPFTVMVTATTASSTRSGSETASSGAVESEGQANNNGQFQTWPRSAPLASPESPSEQYKFSGGQEKNRERTSVGHFERPSMPPPDRPGVAPPERPRQPPGLNPSVGRGHQRSASTGAMINQITVSYEAPAGIPNAGSLTSYTILEGDQDNGNLNTGVGSESVNTAAYSQGSVGPGLSHTLGRHSSMRPRPTPPPPPPPVARESEDTKL
ncbi:unnamed protein product [Lymnaea stagnalis]|uniref:Rho GTPase-activating protein 44 n=1 Tax=Lymnaea stagnalis TaxID=6523 RepID=A0AAV2IH72_LYMST